MPSEDRSALMQGLRQTSFTAVLALVASGGYLLAEVNKEIETLKERVSTQSGSDHADRIVRLEIQIKTLENTLERIERDMDRRMDRFER